MASLNAFEARKRTTVLALILMASPVCGLRPMRALRCAFTARPRFGITNFPAAPLHSFTASLKSSSKKSAAVFLGVPHFSARCDTTFVLLIGLAAISILILLIFFMSLEVREARRGLSPWLHRKIRVAGHYSQGFLRTQAKSREKRRKNAYFLRL